MADAMLSDSTRLVTGGIDTHKEIHVAAVVDALGAEIATRAFPTTEDGYRALAGWLGSHGELVRVGIEGCGSWGAGIARHLRSDSVTVVEINRPNRQTRRRSGKSDPLDALAAAGVPAGPVLDFDAAVSHPQTQAMGFLQPLAYPDLDGAPPVARMPLDFSAFEPVQRRAPTVGEHTDEVLAELGYDAAAIARLHAAGVV